MQKPTIRLIHHMARTGGTVIAKCLGCMDEVILLSEIHPLGTKQFNPVLQAANWHQLFSEQEIKDIFSKPKPFNDAIGLINDKVGKQGKKLLLRDWSHLDFTAVPYLQKPSFRLLLYETMAQDFDIIRMATTRHPIDQWLSLNRLAVINGKISVEQYLYGYLRFAEQAKEIGFIRYEDFTRQPDETLKQITNTLQLSFDPEYKNKWMHYHNITGDPGNTWQEIRPRSRPQLDQEFLQRFADNNDYRSALQILGYEHYGA